MRVPGAVAKGGAEGLLCVGLPDGRGLAVKAEDGASRATAPAVAWILGISALAETPLEDSRGEHVGAIAAEARVAPKSSYRFSRSAVESAAPDAWRAGSQHPGSFRSTSDTLHG